MRFQLIFSLLLQPLCCFIHLQVFPRQAASQARPTWLGRGFRQLAGPNCTLWRSVGWRTCRVLSAF